jgi:DNA uptake protein ComE-like DNA-binding protein
MSGTTETKKVNINLDDEIRLQHVAHLTKKEAEDLVRFRKEHGSFRSWKDLKLVDGFSDATVKALVDIGASLGGTEEEGEQIHN